MEYRGSRPVQLEGEYYMYLITVDAFSGFCKFLLQVIVCIVGSLQPMAALSLTFLSNKVDMYGRF